MEYKTHQTAYDYLISRDYSDIMDSLDITSESELNRDSLQRLIDHYTWFKIGGTPQEELFDAGFDFGVAFGLLDK